MYRFGTVAKSFPWRGDRCKAWQVNGLAQDCTLGGGARSLSVKGPAPSTLSQAWRAVLTGAWRQAAPRGCPPIGLPCSGSPVPSAVGEGWPQAGASGLFLQLVRCAYVIILMAVYWCTEVIPLAVTSLLPALLFPLFKILDSKQVSRPRGPSGFLLLPLVHSPSPSPCCLGLGRPEKPSWGFSLARRHTT